MPFSYQYDFSEPDEGNLEFQKAIFTGNLAQVQKMIEDGVDVNQPNWLGAVTPLEIAVESGYIEIVKALLEAGADPDFGMSSNPLFDAARCGWFEITEMLIKAGAKIEMGNYEALACAAGNGHLQIVKLLVEVGADVNAHDEDSLPPLFRAATEGHQEVFDYLYPLTDLKLLKESVLAALFSAAIDGNLKTLQLLSKVGIDLNSRVYEGKTALMLAAEFQQVQIVETLLSLGVEVDAKNEQKKTALFYAARFRTREEAGIPGGVETRCQIIRLLFEAGADVNIKDEEGKTPLMYAAEYGLPEMVALLLELGSDIHERDNQGNTVLTIAKNKSFLLRVNTVLFSRLKKLLLKAGAIED